MFDDIIHPTYPMDSLWATSLIQIGQRAYNANSEAGTTGTVVSLTSPNKVTVLLDGKGGTAVWPDDEVRHGEAPEIRHQITLDLSRSDLTEVFRICNGWTMKSRTEMRERILDRWSITSCILIEILDKIPAGLLDEIEGTE